MVGYICKFSAINQKTRANSHTKKILINVYAIGELYGINQSITSKSNTHK